MSTSLGPTSTLPLGPMLSSLGSMSTYLGPTSTSSLRHVDIFPGAHVDIPGTPVDIIPGSHVIFPGAHIDIPGTHVDIIPGTHVDVIPGAQVDIIPGAHVDIIPGVHHVSWWVPGIERLGPKSDSLPNAEFNNAWSYACISQYVVIKQGNNSPKFDLIGCHSPPDVRCTCCGQANFEAIHCLRTCCVSVQ